MREVRFVAAAAVALGLTGCAAPTVWQGPTSSAPTQNAQFYKDKLECEEKANVAIPSKQIPMDPRLTPLQQSQVMGYNATADMSRPILLGQYFRECMMSRGYTPG